MAEGLFVLSRKQPVSYLPPRDAWIVDPSRFHRFYAPIDDRGFVVPDATVETIKDLFVDGYEWPVDGAYQVTRPDVHHFHWTRRLYDSSNYHGNPIPSIWRDLPTVKAIVPRQFHNVIHAVTLPPERPKLAEMDKHVKAYIVAEQLFQAAENASLLQSMFSDENVISDSTSSIANEMLIDAFNRQFRGYREQIEAMMAIQGLQTLRLDLTRLEKMRPKDVVRQLGSIAGRQVVNYVPLLPTTQVAV